SISEGFCNAVLEAQAMMLPVVCSDADGLPENVQDGVTGFIVPRRNPEALAASLLKFARDPELRARMGTAGRHRVEREFSLSANVSQFVTFYERTLAGSDARAGGEEAHES
ncbi:MAG: glycosyltransferase, partial [Candidatus Bipolaricaulota bacterium]